MSNRSRDVMVGLFVLIGLACMAVLIVLFGGSKAFFGKRYPVTARFDKVVGVREGTDVTLAGVWAGSVTQVRLANPANPTQGVNVVMDLDPKFFIPLGSKAVVTTPLMGQSAINIIPPAVTAALLPQDGSAAIPGEMRNPLEQVIDPKLMDTFENAAARIADLAQALTPAAAAMEKLLEARSTQRVDSQPAGSPEAVMANLSTAIQRIDLVLKNVNQVIGDPMVQGNFKQTFANFQAASAEAKEAVASIRAFGDEAQKAMVSAHQVVNRVDAAVVTTHTHIDALGKSLVSNTEQLSRILDNVTKVTQQAAEGGGTVGMLLRDPKFYEELVLTVQRLGNAAAELQVLIKQWQKQGLLGAARGG